MKKTIKKYLAMMAAASILLSGCNSNEPTKKTVKTEDENTVERKKETKTDKKEEIKTPGAKYSTVAALKQKYGIEEENEIKPLYNIPKDMHFTFKFHSMVDPYKAVTVHTDKSCDINSMVNVAYGGFSTPYGEDILIAPSSPVLNCTDRLDYTDEPTYGYAPLYYLCIRYDMDSMEVKKLDDPIIVPFTLKGEVQTPTAYPKISMDGTFSVNWNPVSGADSYRIYEAYASSSDQERSKGTLRRENGYSGEHLRLIAEIGADKESYSDFGSDSNTLSDLNGDIYIQNVFSLNNYYVTAVKDGKESFFSQEVSGWKYNSQLPKRFDSYNGFERDGLKVTHLPETVEIEMADGSHTMMPINFKKVDSTYENLPGGNDVATYEYEIIGTKLKGKIEYHDANGSYPEEITSLASPNYGIYQIDVSVDTVPAPEVPTINDESYGNRYIDLGKSTKYHKESMATYSADALLMRADMDAERMLLSGQYQRDPLSIDYVESFGIPMDPVYPDQTEDIQIPAETTIAETSEVETEEETVPETYEEETSVQVQEPEPVNEDRDDGITASNVIEEQIDSTRRQVNEGNETEYEISGYPSFADTMEEEYIAENMINRKETFSVQAFPALQDMNNLRDVILKVYYQNPYVFGFSNAGYDPYSMEVMIEYSMSKEEIEKRQKEIDKESDRILAQVIDNSMDEAERVKAIYEYLEANTEYDMDALDAAEASGFQDISGFDDSFNTYGIMCKKKGVCQSYAYSMDLLCKKADIHSKMLTGYMSKTMPHAWNAIEYDGRWYWIDATNNGKTSGIPYLLYQTSSDTAEDMDYILDDSFDLDFNLDYVENSDTSRDWYVENGLVAKNAEEMIDKIAQNYDGNGSFAIRPAFELDMSDSFLRTLAIKLSSKGIDITEMKFGDFMGYFVLVN